MQSDTTRTFILSGQIISIHTGAGLPNLRIEAWDRALLCPDIIDCVLSSADGHFELSLPEDYIQRLFPGRSVELYFRIFQDDRLIASTQDTIVWRVGTLESEALIRVDPEQDLTGIASPALFVVRGQLTQPDTGPLPSTTLRAYDRRLGQSGLQDALLGEATTDSAGRYQIRYTPPVDARRGKIKAELLLRAFDTAGQQVAESALLCHAPTIAQVDLSTGEGLYLGPSEFEVIMARIAPALGDAQASAADLDDATLSYLACSARVALEQLEILRAATQLSRSTDIPPEIFYGLARTGLPADLHALGAHTTATRREALEQALEENIIPQSVGASLETYLSALHQAILAYAFQPSPEPGKLSLGDLLGTSLAPLATQQEFLSLYLSREGTITEFWAKLTSQTTFQDIKIIDDLKLTIQLSLLTQGNLPLMLRIRDLRLQGDIRTLRDLTTYDAAKWTQTLIDAAAGGDISIPTHIPGQTVDERIQNYVKSMLDTLELTYPHEFLKQSFALTPNIDVSLVRALRSANPELDPSQPLPEDISWSGIDPADQEQARASWSALVSEVRTFPAFDTTALFDPNATTTFDNPIRTSAKLFLSNATDFDLRTTVVDTYLTDHPDALASIATSLHEAVIDQIKATQRIARLTTCAAHTSALMGSGLSSAGQIARMPRKRFVKHFGTVLGSDQEALALHANASFQAASTQTVNLSVQQAYSPILPWAIRGCQQALTTTTIPGLPNLTSLFGSMDLCDCAHCSSIYSPAAYFVDLLHFLDPDPWISSGPNTQKPVDALLSRRPDLTRIALSCANTNTPIPYIDLVNEVLESYIQIRFVKQGDPSLELEAHDTGSATAAELRAVPQHTLDAAYQELQSAIYPSSLPFHQPLAVVRAYLGHLGKSRLELLETFQKNGTPTDEALVAEALALSPEEYEIILGKQLDPPRVLREFYGYDADTLTFHDPVQNTDIVEPWQANVARVPEILQRTGLDYVELAELVKTWFVNRDQAIEATRITLEGPAGDCDLAKVQLTHLSDDALDRMHRFIRLHRRLEWSSADLDRALFAIGASDLDVAALRKLAQIKRLADDLDCSVVQLSSLWAPIDTWGEDSLYLSLFQNRAVARLDEDLVSGLALNYPFGSPDIKSDTALPTIKDAGNPLNDYLPVILAALEITEPDLQLFMEHANLTPSSPLDLENLSALYRRALLARSLRLSARDLITRMALSGIDPFQAHEPEGTRLFVENTRQARQSGVSLVLLDYLFRHSPVAAGFLEPTSAQVEMLVNALRSELIQIAEEDITASSSNEELNRAAVVRALADSLILEEPLTRTLLETLIASPDNAGLQAMDDFLALVGVGLSASYFASPDFTGAPVTQVDAQMSFTWTAATPPPVPMDANPFSARWTGRIAAPKDDTYTFHLRTDGGVRLWIDGQLVLDAWADPSDPNAPPVTEHTSLPVSLTADGLHEITLDYVLRQKDAAELTVSWSSGTITKSQISTSLLYPDSQADSFDFVTRTYRRLHKASLLIRHFNATEREIVHLSKNPALFAGFDLNALPLVSTDPPVNFAIWSRLSALFRLRDSLPVRDKGLIDLFELAATAEDKTALPALVVEVTGWDAAEVDALFGPSGFNLSNVDLQNEERLIELEACISLSRRMGVSVERLFTWASQVPDAAAARDVVQTVKAHYQGDKWLEVAQSLNDPLREAQRDALVAYLVPRMRDQGISSAEQLFEFFLIDVGMSPCMASSRIKQAISSVQLFVQRCLLNLEPSVSLDDIDADQWAWRKNYRVWEANRKVFLYPENWIEPELRDDKSPFFKELETELLQSDVTLETAEQAFRHYLEKLDTVARLEICGMYWHEEPSSSPADPGIDVLHVFGRSLNEPHHYYYRRLEGHREWTPWEPVKLDIQGDHVIPVVYNRRLLLFWPIFTQKAESKQPKGEGVQPSMYWEIKLAWSEYKHGKWAPKRVTSSPVESHAVRLGSSTIYHLPPVVDHTFRALLEGGSLLIKVVARQLGTSYDLRFVGSFQLDDCHGTLTASPSLGAKAGNVKYIPERPLKGLVSAITFESRTAPRDVATTWPEPSIDSYPKVPLTLVGMGGDLFGHRPVLGRTESRFRVIYPHQFENKSLPSSFGAYLFSYPFFFQDKQRSYLALPGLAYPKHTAHLGTIIESIGPDVLIETNPTFGTIDTPVASSTQITENFPVEVASTKVERLFWSSFDHPFTCAFIKGLNRDGIPGLLKLANQQLTKDTLAYGSNFFTWVYQPTDQVAFPRPSCEVEFEHGGAYAAYNWEIFFHAPLLIATRLSAEQRYEEAQSWFHYIFDPTTDSTDAVPARFWKVRPFYENTEYDRAQDLLALLCYSGTDPTLVRRKQRVEVQVKAWMSHPFEPHRIARLRLVAYQKTVVMKYIDNLLAWADQLFRRDTIESINEATQLYVLARNILGPRPQRVPARGSVTPLTYADMRTQLSSFSNVAVKLENILFPFASEVQAQGGVESILAAGETLYFCTPNNDKLLAYWDTVEDRLFKIRHCMNIEGTERTLPLFEPPIDPALLVRARAAGVDLGSVLADLNAPLPYYRFSFVLQKALELCGDLRMLGGALLAALEKKDAEELANIRASQETTLLSAIRVVKERQIEEARLNLAGLEKTRKVVEERYGFYRDIKARIPEEEGYLKLLDVSQRHQEQSQQADLLAAWGGQLPNLTTGASGMASPVATATMGGLNFVAATQAEARAMSMMASQYSFQANMSSIKGGWSRRWEEWKLQERLAKAELAQIDKQIEAAKIRMVIAEKDLENHDRQIENATLVEEFLRDKYTNQELYSWMVSQVAALYFQTYKLAYDMAKRAERCFQFERGLSASNFIQFGYWDGLKKGLLAGERLHLDLKRLEIAYLDQNKREYELVRQVSLLLHDPSQLIALKETGTCEIVLPEELFDADYPGHYFRRIKSVSVTIPGVNGAFSSVNCTLTLLENRIRTKGSAGGVYREQETGDDPRFLYDYAAVQSIATSHGQNDAGLFELNFRDERYLPFEGAGAISRWRLDLPRECNSFDFTSISDAILRISYTAREGGEALRTAARAWLKAQIKVHAAGETGIVPPLQRFVSARHEFAVAWQGFSSGVAQDGQGTLDMELGYDHFSYLLRNEDIRVTRVDVYLHTASAVADLSITPPLAQPPISVSLEAMTNEPTVRHGSMEVAAGSTPWDAIGLWHIAANTTSFTTDDLEIVFTVALA